jgi:hypothetical protein
MRTTLFASVFFFAVAAVAMAQSASCLDVADESHHQLLFQNQDVRVLVLELPRLAASQSHCHSRPYLDIVVTNGKSSNTVEGSAPVTRDGNEPEAHFIYSPMQHVRNEGMTTYRELIVETMHPASYQTSDGAYDTDLFPGDLGTVKPSWTVSFSRGAITASKSQLAPGAQMEISTPAHVLLALTDLELSQTSGTSAHSLHLDAQEIRILPGGTSFRLINTGKNPAKFILVEF